MSLTSKKIADLCGVSRGTVDRALNNRPGIKPETKAKILKVAQELGYRPHFLAQSLVNKKTMSIGLVIFDLKNRFFSQLVTFIEASAREMGYFIYVTFTNKDPMIEKQCIENLANRKVDGIILISVNKGKAFDDYLKQFNIPIITFGNKISPHWPYLSIDDRQAIKDACQYLLAKKYQKIIFFSPPLANPKHLNIYALEQRFLGLKDVVKMNSQLEAQVILEQDIELALDQIQLTNDKKTAILCTSDIYALKLLNHLKQRGVKVPEDIGLMGFDHIDILKYITPSIATIDYSAEDLSKQIVASMIRQINGEPLPENQLLNHQIIEGSSIK